MVSVTLKVPLSLEHAWLSSYPEHLEYWERFQRDQYTVIQSLGLPRVCRRSLQRNFFSFDFATRFAIMQSHP